MNYLKIYPATIADGPGIRVSIYVSGCHFHCKGCHNPESWDFEAGQPYTEDTIQKILTLADHDYISGLSILGGEPLSPNNITAVANLAMIFKQKFPNKTIWVWTGYKFDDLLDDLVLIYDILLHNIDVLVEGNFIEELRDITKDNLWRGSTNQRVIDIKQSVKGFDYTKYKKVYLAGIPNNE